MSRTTDARSRARMAVALCALLALMLAWSSTAQAHGQHHGAPPLTFGVYAGGEDGTRTGLAPGPPQDPRSIQHALDELQGGHEPFLVRAFTGFGDEPFDLRDADSAVDDHWYQFGIMTSDYTPKPAFATVRRLSRELGPRH